MKNAGKFSSYLQWYPRFTQDAAKGSQENIRLSNASINKKTICFPKWPQSWQVSWPKNRRVPNKNTALKEKRRWPLSPWNTTWSQEKEANPYMFSDRDAGAHGGGGPGRGGQRERSSAESDRCNSNLRKVLYRLCLSSENVSYKPTYTDVCVLNK